MIRRLLYRVIPFLCCLALLIPVFLGAVVPASALSSDPYIGGVAWDYYATDISYNANGVTYTIEPASPGGKSWFSYVNSSHGISLGEYTDSFSFSIYEEGPGTLKIYPTGGAGGGARYFYCETLPDGAFMEFFINYNYGLNYWSRRFYVQLIWFDSEGNVIRSDTSDMCSNTPDDVILSAGINVSKPQGALYFDYCFVFPDMTGYSWEDGGWGEQSASITVSDVNSSFSVHIPGIDYSKYIVNSYLENNRAVFECDIPDAKPWWALREYHYGVEQSRVTHTGDSFDVSLQDGQDGYSYWLAVMPTGALDCVYSVSSIPVGSDFSATLELTREGYADYPGDVYFTLLYYDINKNWISEKRVYLGESDLEGIHTGTITFEPPEGAEYFLYRFDFEDFDCDTDGVSGEKTYWRVDTYFDISFPDPTAPVADTLLNYSDYITSTETSSAGSVVNISFPPSKLKPRWDLYKDSTFEHLDTFIGAAGSFSSLLYPEEQYGDSYMISFNPLGDGNSLSIKNMPEGTLLNLNFSFGVASGLSFNVPDLYLDYYWYDSSGKVVCFETDYYGSLGDYIDSSLGMYVLSQNHSVVKPYGAVSLIVRCRLSGLSPLNHPSSLPVQAGDFSLSFTVPSETIEQEKNDATNDKLDNIITGGSSGDKLDDVSDKLDQAGSQLGGAVDDLQDANNALPVMPDDLQSVITGNTGSVTGSDLSSLMPWQDPTFGAFWNVLFTPTVASVSVALLLYFVFGKARA